METPQRKQDAKKPGVHNLSATSKQNMTMAEFARCYPAIHNILTEFSTLTRPQRQLPPPTTAEWTEYHEADGFRDYHLGLPKKANPWRILGGTLTAKAYEEAWDEGWDTAADIYEKAETTDRTCKDKNCPKHHSGKGKTCTHATK